jgi:hypothetical protein
VLNALRRGLAAFIFLTFLGQRASADSSHPGPGAELADTFTIRGDKVHPMVIRELWQDDQGNGQVKNEVDLLAEQTRRIERGEKYEVVGKSVSSPYWSEEAFREYGGFAYSRLGSLANGNIVLNVSNNEGGSYSSHSVLVLRVLESTGKLTLKRIDQERLTCEPVTITGDAIELGACENKKLGDAPVRVLRYGPDGMPHNKSLKPTNPAQGGR